MGMFADPSVNDQAPGGPTTAEQGAAKPYLRPGAEPALSGSALDPGAAIEPDMMPAVLRPTSRPTLPVTHGLPYGPGANFTQAPDEPPERFRQRVAASLAASPLATPAVKALADRLAKGA